MSARAGFSHTHPEGNAVKPVRTGPMGLRKFPIADCSSEIRVLQPGGQLVAEPQATVPHTLPFTWQTAAVRSMGPFIDPDLSTTIMTLGGMPCATIPASSVVTPTVVG
jgi:hypothetical protein